MNCPKFLLLSLLLAVAAVGCQGADPVVNNPPPGDTTRPSVSATVPASAAVLVAFNANITATFSEGMDPAGISAATFTLKDGSTVVAGSVSFVGTVATFAPTSALAASTTYTAAISMGAHDLAGNGLAAPYTWSFTTGMAPDVTPPTVSATVPGDAATGVAFNASISATFGEAMAPSSITTDTFMLSQGATPVPVTVTAAGSVATMAPTSALSPSTTYTATISSGATDLAGNGLAAPFTWSFTTGMAADLTPPTVVSTNPADGATSVVLNRHVTATFSEGVDQASISTATFTLKQGPTPIPGAVTSMGSVATLVPATAFAAGTTYTATISTGARDLAGHGLVAPFIWSFTTSSATAAGPAPVALGTASTFAILSKTGITNVPTSAVTGDVGTSPITGAAIAGLTCAEVVGNVYVVDAAGPVPCAVPDASFLTTVVGDMEIAYADAAGRVSPDFTELGAGNIDGMTLVPGLYTWSSGVSIPVGVTLAGGANDVWIFQVAQDLVVANDARVTLSGGAQAGNVFWQVAGQATIGTTATVEGTILSKTLISMNTGAVLNGRALAQTAVTLQANTLTRP